MTSLHDMNIQEALNHSSFGGSSIPSPTQAMLMMQKALSAGSPAFPGSIPPSSSYPPKDMSAVAAASLGAGSPTNLMQQYYQMYQKLWGAAIANGHASPNGQLTPSFTSGPLSPHVPLPPSLPSSIPTTSTSTNNLLMSSATSSLSSPTSTQSSGLASHQPSPIESFHHNANNQGKLYAV